jgi:hypothetical protein
LSPQHAIFHAFVATRIADVSMGTNTKRPLTNAERQARYRKKHLNADSDKERAQFVFAVGTKKRLGRIARHYRYPSATALIERWAVLAASKVAEQEQQARKEPGTSYEHNG